MKQKLLIVEDDRLMAEAAADYFAGKGWEVKKAEDGAEALEIMDRESFHLILLDVMMPGKDGFAVCREIRSHSDVPVIFITARVLEEDMLNGYSLGADDYVTKPFTPLELLARVNSHLRRYSKYLSALKEDGNKDHIYTIGGLELNEDTVEVSVDGEPVKLTPMEFKIVQLLIKNPGRVFSADEIYERIWNEKAVNTDTIMVHVRNIREKIEIDPKNPKYLKVVWGVGYKIDRQ